jgi:hypothetical protein
LNNAFGELSDTVKKIINRSQGKKIGLEDKGMTNDFLKAVQNQYNLDLSGQDAVNIHQFIGALARSLKNCQEIKI